VAVQDSSNSSYHVDRVRTADLGVDLQIPLPATVTAVTQLAAAPALPHTLGVSLSDSSAGYCIAIYDDATPRGPALPATTMSGDPNEFVIDGFAWSSDATAMYVSIFGFHLPTVMASLAAAAPGPSAVRAMVFPDSNGIGNMEDVNGRVLFGSGDIFDPTGFAFDAPFVPAVPEGFVGAVAAFDTGLNRAYFAANIPPDQPQGAPILLQAFNLTTRGLLWTAQLQVTQTPAYLTRWGSDGLAFRATPTGSSPSELVLLSGAGIAQ
jgi:hypothetical protein